MAQRPKATNMDMSIPTEEPKKAPEEVMEKKDSKDEKKVTVARVRGKKYNQSKGNIDSNKLYNLVDAVELVKKTSYSKFDGTVELHLVVKKTGMSAQVTLPFAGGREKKVEVADDATLEKLKAGKVDFDILLATAEMMPKLVPFARILGPKGMMPNPKNGTLIKSLDAAKKFSSNSVTIKTEKEAPLIHTTAGKVSQPEKEIEANVDAIMNGINKRQIVKAYVKASMGPAIKLAL